MGNTSEDLVRRIRNLEAKLEAQKTQRKKIEHDMIITSSEIENYRSILRRRQAVRT